MFKYLLLLFTISVALNSSAQLFHQKQNQYDEGDTLRGKLTKERTCFDVLHYDLNLEVNPKEQSIRGYNLITYKVVEDFKRLQIDLFSNMTIDRIETVRGDELKFTRKFNAVFVDFPLKQRQHTTGKIKVFYHGKPTVAKRAPWDGGFVWTKDEDGNDWIGVACQGTGASLWWPNKDHLSDEPDSVRVTCKVPNGLFFVGNGQFEGSDYTQDGFSIFTWKTTYPINNYNVTLNIGNYVHFSDTFASKEAYGKLPLDYYVLPYHLKKAKKQFKQVKPMMRVFEHYFGPYPFHRDGYALVETPYLGMEHQSAIAYGNNYKKGYNGSDYSRIGLNFDYIIIHETGHEWWGNSVSCTDLADLWIHEGFCTYSEALYVEGMYDYEKAMEYVNAKRSSIGNLTRILGDYGVNNEGAGDMYNKGMLILNTLRHQMQNDSMWFKLVRSISNDRFKRQPASTQKLLAYIHDFTGKDYSSFFAQYLKYPKIPVLEYHMRQMEPEVWEVNYRWRTDVEQFEMLAPIAINSKKHTWVPVSNEWEKINIYQSKKPTLTVDVNKAYVGVEAYEPK